MRTSGRPFFVSILVSAAFVFAANLTGQTLEHRPQAKPEHRSGEKPPGGDNEPLAPARPIISVGTNLQVEITRHYPMKANEAIEARLLHPIFARGELAVPENTLLHGTVVALVADKKTRWHGRLRGDFTPFHTVQVQFDELLLAGGPVSISTDLAENGAPVLHLAAPGATARQSVLAKAWAQAKSQVRDRMAYFTTPGFGDRALQGLYHQLPYHPERIEAHTMWSFGLAAPLVLHDSLPAAGASASHVTAASNHPETWAVNAQLTADLTSSTAKAGDSVQALVVEPVFDKNRQLVVPQGSVLMGKVSAANAARSFGRNGKLRFNFQQVRFPEGAFQGVQGSLAGATAESQQALSLDAEGTITPRNQSSAIAPILLTLLAGRALDNDGNFVAGASVASNGFGLVGRVVGVAAGNRNLAAGIGYYAAGLSVYENFLRPGRDVVFHKNTRIEIETTPLRAPLLTPEIE